jgi:hypothetical protein
MNSNRKRYRLVSWNEAIEGGGDEEVKEG